MSSNTHNKQAQRFRFVVVLPRTERPPVGLVGVIGDEQRLFARRRLTFLALVLSHCSSAIGLKQGRMC